MARHSTLIVKTCQSRLLILFHFEFQNWVENKAKELVLLCTHYCTQSTESLFCIELVTWNHKFNAIVCDINTASIILPWTERQNSSQVLTLHGNWKIYPKSCNLIHKWFNELPNKRLNTSIQQGKQLDLLIAQIGIYLSKNKTPGDIIQ